MDLDAEPELLDAGGRAPEMPVVRVPMVRYTYPLPYGVSIAIAAENPAPIVAGPFGPYNTDANQIPSTMSSCAALTTPISGAGVIGGPVATNMTNACFLNAAFFNPLRDAMPNFVLRGRVEQPWGHLQLGLITEGLELNDGMFLRKSYIGYGGSVSGNFFTWGKDSLVFGLIAGNGLLGVSSNFGGALAGQPFIAADSRSFFTTNRSLYDSAVLAKTIDTYSPHIGYQHWWTPELRSTVDFSMLQAHVSSFLVQASGRNANPKRLSIGHANLLWSPAAFVDLGLEGARGQRVTVGNIRGNSYTIQSSLKFRF